MSSWAEAVGLVNVIGIPGRTEHAWKKAGVEAGRVPRFRGRGRAAQGPMREARGSMTPGRG
jgi:hypothetical protein